MNKRKAVNYTLKGIIILIISAAVMVLFWYHDLLYQYGLLALAIFGGLGVAGLISALGWLTRPYSPLKKKSKKTLRFSFDDMTKVVFGAVSMLAIPSGADKPPRYGSTCVARIEGNGKNVIANLAIRDVRRKIVGDLEEPDLEQLGVRDVGSFQRKLENSGRPVTLEDEVYLVEFDILDKGRP